MPSSELSKSRSLMVAAVKNGVLPELHARGFSEIPHHKEPIPMWHLNRPRADGGYDVISVIFDKKRRPLFDAVINTIESGGVKRPWGEIIAADEASAVVPLTRVQITKKKRSGLVFAALLRWLGRDWFGFKPREDAAFNKQAATAACAEFIACLDQAERWWRTRELGPNLVEANIGAVLRDPNAANAAVVILKGTDRKF